MLQRFNGVLFFTFVPSSLTDSLFSFVLVINYALSNLHSYASDFGGRASTDPGHALDKENHVLLEDDLVDDDDW